jgi:SAM-dependent methyltransferase
LTVSAPGYWDTVADRWVTARPQRLWRTHSDRVNRALCERWLPRQPVGRLLKTDVFDEVAAAGLLPLLQRHARQVVGIDHSLRMVESVPASAVALVASDVRSLPFPDGAFDRVFSNSTLDHFESADDIRCALKELARVLRPDGELLLTLDNLANPVVRVRNALPSRPLERAGLIPYRMGATCGPARLRAFCTDAGLDVLDLGTAMHCPRAPAVAIANILDRVGTPNAGEAFLRALDAFEVMSRWPTRYLSGYFLTVRARRRVSSR